MTLPYYTNDDVTIYQGDCLTVMPQLPEQSIDAIITDIPYGTTKCSWDQIIPFVDMWREIKRLIKPHGAVVLFGNEPFSSTLRTSNLDQYKYDWIWNKAQSGSFWTAKYRPLQISENISIFGKDKILYNPQMRKGVMKSKGGASSPVRITANMESTPQTFSDVYHPTTILYFPNCASKSKRMHPTQKPLALMQYLIRTYTNEGDTVLDFTMGSGTTLEAAQIEGRKAIGIERDTGKNGECLGYCDYAIERIEKRKAMMF